jgi:NADP-dependent aldehyde dehydrogenase
MTAVVSHDPRTGEVVGTASPSSAAQVEETVARASAAASAIADASPGERRRWLHAVAVALEERVDEVAAVADRETGLGLERLSSEVGRAAGQLRFYGDVAAEGSYLDATLDTDDTGAVRLARINRPLGPVAVFGASNFPLAFSVLGNDTASALAAGCPVVAKAHDAHVSLSILVADIATAALLSAGAPEGALGVVAGFDAGVALVGDADVSAVGFTGSQAGGLALWRLANERPVPIPVYAEMGTVNPVVVTPAAAEDAASIAQGFVGSFTLGSGQYCTKPGLMFAPQQAAMPTKVADALRRLGPKPLMLTEGIAAALESGLAELEEAGADLVYATRTGGAGWAGAAAVLEVPLAALQSGSRLLEECFGPVVLVAEYDEPSEVVAAVGELQGCLAAAVFAATPDDPDAPEILSSLARIAGRVCVNEWTTGVAASWAQHHGGPWPATTQPATTSVGAAALRRWLRPVAYQAIPDRWLPQPLRAENPWRIPRRVNGSIVPVTELEPHG